MFTWNIANSHVVAASPHAAKQNATLFGNRASSRALSAAMWRHERNNSAIAIASRVIANNCYARALRITKFAPTDRGTDANASLQQGRISAAFAPVKAYRNMYACVLPKS